MESENQERLLWFLAGAGLGAGVALFANSKTGRRARRYLVRKAEEGTEKLAETGEEILEKGKKIYERGKEMVDDTVELIDRGRRMVRR